LRVVDLRKRARTQHRTFIDIKASPYMQKGLEQLPRFRSKEGGYGCNKNVIRIWELVMCMYQVLELKRDGQIEDHVKRRHHGFFRWSTFSIVLSWCFSLSSFKSIVLSS